MIAAVRYSKASADTSKENQSIAKGRINTRAEVTKAAIRGREESKDRIPNSTELSSNTSTSQGQCSDFISGTA